MKILIALLILALSSPCWGGSHSVSVVVGPAAGGDPCAGYLVCQNLESTGYDNGETWTEYVGSGSTVDEDYASSPLLGSQSLRIVGGTDWGTTYITFAATGTAYGKIRVRIVDLPNTATNFVSINNGLTELVNLQLRSDGTLSSQGVDNTSYGSYAMSTGAAYYIWWHYAKGTGSNAVWWVRISDSNTKPGSNDSGGTNGNSTADVSRIWLSMVGTGNEVIFDEIIVSGSEL